VLEQVFPTLPGQAQRPAAKLTPTAIALRWALPWLLTLAVASSVSGVLTSATRSARSLATVTSSVLTEHKYQALDGLAVPGGDGPHLTP